MHQNIRTVLFSAIPILIFVLGFQNCAPAVKKDELSSKDCRESGPANTRLPSEATEFKLSAERSEVHGIGDQDVDQLYIESIEIDYGIVRYDSVQLAIAGGDLVVLETVSGRLRVKKRIQLGERMCALGFVLRDHQVEVAGYTIKNFATPSAEVQFRGCDKVLQTSASCTNSGSNSSSQNNSANDTNSYSERDGSESKSNDFSRSGTSADQSGRMGGLTTGCAGSAEGQASWQYADSSMVADPACRGVRVRYIQITTEREVICQRGKKVPTGRTRENKKTVGGC